MRAEYLHSAEIICVGTELLIGHTLNTNAGYLANQLAELGISSYRQIVVGDNKDRLLQQIRESAGRSDVVILTGGLGPTQDDLTMETAAAAAGLPLVLDQASLEHIEGLFRSIGRDMTENNRKQAMLPLGATILKNNNGTAPGAIFPCAAPSEEQLDHEALLILLPGPPSEMTLMFNESVAPFLLAQAPHYFRSVYVRLIGIGESAAESRIQDLMDAQDNPTIAPYASEGECMFRITQRFSRVQADERDLLTPLVQELKTRFGKHIYEIGSRSMPEVVLALLKEKKATVSFAESCTGGMAASAMVDFPGASLVLAGGVVAYSNQAKVDLLKVNPLLLEKEGAVSYNCALAMAEGCRKQVGSDFAVSITGIAGPEGGTKEKPVGLVYIAVASATATRARQLRLSGNRTRVRRIATLQAYNLLREMLV